MPKSRSNYWKPKIARNKKRDREVTRQLRRCGWEVLRVWEHALKRPSKMLGRLKVILASRKRLD
jgi:DNA mismatch endonuclease (patch repair protein)